MRLRHQLAAYSPIHARAVVAAATGMIRGSGEAKDALRQVLRSQYDSADVVLVDSGTSALQIALRLAIATQPSNALVALPAFSCFDVATAAVAVAARTTLYDMDPNTLGPDMDSLERSLRSGATVVVIAPLYGVPVHWENLDALAAQHGALLVEDAAQGHGASWRGRPLGSLGRLSTLSFGRGKGWTGGQGGAVLIRTGANAATVGGASMLAELKNVGALAAQWVLGRPSVYGLPRALPSLGLGETHYRPPRAPAGLPTTAARAILQSVEAANAEAAIRRRRAENYRAGLSRAHFIQAPSASVPGYIRFPVRVQGGMENLSGTSRLSALGVAQSYPSTLADLPALQATLTRPHPTLPGARALVSELITLPTHSLMAPRETASIVELLSRGLQ